MKHTKCYIPGYPRPQLVRGDWQSLDGEWSFGFGEEVTAKDAVAGKLPRTIVVPFTYECALSGIGEQAAHASVWYARKVKKKTGKRTLIHFDGADYCTELYVNGVKVGKHTGAYTRFGWDITDSLTAGDNVLAVRCEDGNRPVQVRGKQRWESENHGCWYVQTTGIYKSVWLEYVSDVYLASLKLSPSLTDNTLTATISVNCPAEDVRVTLSVSFGGQFVGSVSFTAADSCNTAALRLDSGKLVYQVAQWSPSDPALYDVDVTVEKASKVVDEAGSYFGLRDFRAEGDKLLLNNMPVYLKLLLDQGYWTESGITPSDEAAIVRDIELTKEMGFNGVRKHQKVADERYLYYADIMGLFVWCELPSNHWYCDMASQAITREWLAIVEQNYNHPSIVTWVIFNESWGVRNIYSDAAQQNLATGLYYLTKSIDTMRPVISNDGWMHTESDILTLHHYEQDPEKLYAHYDTLEKLTRGDAVNPQYAPFARGFCYRGQPIVISEFGGTAYAGDTDRGWGYGNAVKSDEEFYARFSGLIAAVKRMEVAGYCYTQLTDIQQEVNGLLREDRTPKIAVDLIRKSNEA